MKMSLSEYPHGESPMPRVKVALDFAGNSDEIRLDFFGDCFPGRIMGAFDNGFLLDPNLNIWEANEGPLRAIRMIVEKLPCKVVVNPFSITTSRQYLEVVFTLLGESDGVYVLPSQGVLDALGEVRSAEQAEPDLSLVRHVALFPYQEEVLSWMLGRSASGRGFGLLALEPGLGKTVVSLSYIGSLHASRPYAQTLCICPSSVVSHWERHAASILPSLKVAVLDGPQKERLSQIDSGDWDLAIESVGSARRDAPAWSRRKLDCLIFDEITAAKNRGSKTRAGIRRIRADFKFGLSGTPVLNTVKDLHSELSVLDARYLGSVREFNKRFARPIEEKGDKFAADALKEVIRPCVFRLLKEDALDNLPPKSEYEIMVDLAPGQMELYRQEEASVLRRLQSMTDEQYASDYEERMRIFGAISRLRQLAVTGRTLLQDAPATKIDAAVSLIQSLLNDGHAKIVVFCLFVDGVVDHLAEELESAGIGMLSLVGSTPVKERRGVIERFKDDSGIQVLFISSAGGQGIDLQVADAMVVLSEWWNYGTIQQGIDRIHRIGQQKPVSIYRLLAKETIEERMNALTKRKLDRASLVVRQPHLSLGSLSRSELASLLGDRTHKKGSEAR